MANKIPTERTWHGRGKGSMSKIFKFFFRINKNKVLYFSLTTLLLHARFFPIKLLLVPIFRLKFGCLIVIDTFEGGLEITL